MSKKSFIFLTLLAMLFLFPFLWNLFTGFKPSDEILRYPPSLFPEQFTTGQFQKLLRVGDGIFWQYAKNTVVISGATILVMLTVSLLAAYSLSELPFRGSNLVFLLILSILMIPYQSLIIPLYKLMADLQLLDTKIGMVLIYSTFFMPFCVFMAKNYFSSLPSSLRESALIDGASELDILFRIYVPLSLPAIATIVVYVFLETWNDFLLSLIFTSSNTVKNIQVGIMNFGTARYQNDWGIINAGSAFSCILPVLVFLFLQKYYIQGITSGATKG